MLGRSVLALAVSGCGSSAPKVAVRYPEALGYAAARDSLGLAEFLALPPAERRERRREAAVWLERSRAADHCAVRGRALRTAVGLAPDGVEAWVALAEYAHWLLGGSSTTSYLAAAAAAAARAPAIERDETRFRIALVGAWYHYERGEWREGLAWADSLVALQPEDFLTLQTRGVLLAGAGQWRYAEDVAVQLKRYNVFSPSARWILGLSEWYRGRAKVGAAYFSGASSASGHADRAQVMGEERAQVEAAVRPDPAHRAECWRDMAMLEEVLGSWAEARRRYERAAASLPLDAAACLVRVDHGTLGQSAQLVTMPIWLAFDRYFVTGSISAYADLTRRRFEAATDPAEREFWAAAAIDAAGICIRRGVDATEALRSRGIVFAQLDLDREAWQNLRRARLNFERAGRDDYETLAWLGHVQLKRGEFAAALSHLQRAVELRPEIARSWSDLGLALIHTGDPAAAAQALDRALALDPELVVAWYNRGLMHFQALRWSAAVADLERAARLAPGNAEILELLQRAKQRERGEN